MPAAKRDCTGSVLLSQCVRNRISRSEMPTFALTEKMGGARIPRPSSILFPANTPSHRIDSNFDRDMTWQAI